MFQPYIFGQVLDYFTPKQTVITDKEGLYYILALIGLLFVKTSIYHHVLLEMFLVGLKVRAMCSGIVYSSTINLSKQALEEFTSVGQIMNLLTNTATQFELGFIHIHYVFLLPFEVLVAAICLYFDLGYSGLLGLGVFILVICCECMGLVKTSKTTSRYFFE